MQAQVPQPVPAGTQAAPVSTENAVPLLPAGGGPTFGSPSLLAYGLVSAGLIVLMILALIVRRSKAGGATARRSDLPGPRRGAGQEIEAKQLAGEIAAQLDARADRLERLIEQADERIVLMRELTRDASPASESSPAVARPVQPRPDHGRAAARPFNAPAERGQDGSEESAQEIYALADKGLTPVQIAQRLRTHVGKVELVLALRG